MTRIERSPGVLRVILYQTGNADAGSASLTFTDDPLRLTQWAIKDSRGTQVEIALRDTVFGGRLPSDLFAKPRTRKYHQGRRIVE